MTKQNNNRVVSYNKGNFNKIYFLSQLSLLAFINFRCNAADSKLQKQAFLFISSVNG